MSAPSARVHRDTPRPGSNPDKLRRPGYAPPANVGVGRRGLHTRDRILTSAAKAFLANGFHGTSLDTIAKVAKASRATVYQYFAGKEDIFRELSATAERDVLEHGERLSILGPTVAGVEALHEWLAEWADLYDTHAAVFAEFPGIGTPTSLSVIDAGDFAETYQLEVTDRLRKADLRGLDLHDAAAALGRIPHMVNLYRRRGMLPLPDRSSVTSSLTTALQLMLFPETPDDALVAAASRTVDLPMKREPTVDHPAAPRAADSAALSPIAHEVLSVSSALFAEHGHYAVGMEDIAAAADISRATLYRYFSTKEYILAELIRRAVLEIEAHAWTLSETTAGALQEWMLGYVRFHREYRGVIRAWFDGTAADQLNDAAVEHGIGAFHHAVAVLLGSVDLPPGLDDQVAGAVFLAVLGRMSEPTAAPTPATDERAADLMVNLLHRSLLRSR